MIPKHVPLGALEFHGPHLPIGLDGLTAHGICIQGSRGRGGVVLPTIYQGTGGEHSRYPWTIMMPTGDAIAGTFAPRYVAWPKWARWHDGDSQRPLRRRAARDAQGLGRGMAARGVVADAARRDHSRRP